MRIIVDNEYIQNLIEAYDRLGFIFENDDLCNFLTNDNDYGKVRVTYVNEKHCCITKQIGDLRITDLNSAYMYSNEIADSNVERLANGEAFNNLVYLSAKAESRNRINKLLIEKIIAKQNSNDIDDYVIAEEIEKKEEENRKYEIQKLSNAEVIESNKNKHEVAKTTKKEIVKKKSVPTKVVSVENNEKVANNAKKELNKDSIVITAGLIILATGLVVSSLSLAKACSGTNNVAYETTSDINNDVNIDNSTTNVVNNENNTQEVNDEVVEEPTKDETPIEETPIEEVKEEVNVHSDEYINDVVDSVINTIQLNGDGIIGAKYDRELVEALVRYTHHNYPEYTGDNILSNEVAYEDMSELISRGFDISIFYKGLNNHENLSALYNATKDLKQEKGNYEDEFKIYMCMDIIMDEMNQNNFPEAIALRAYVDNYSIIPSMQMARQQAGVLEMKDTQDLWKDVNKDGQITYEENAEGKGYNDEKAAAMAVKYGQMDSQKCAQIYERISTDNQNSELTQIVYRAIDEDETMVKSR